MVVAALEGTVWSGVCLPVVITFDKNDGWCNSNHLSSDKVRVKAVYRKCAASPTLPKLFYKYVPTFLKCFLACNRLATCMRFGMHCPHNSRYTAAHVSLGARS